MNQLSLLSEKNTSISELSDLSVKQISHTFNPAVITAYNNLTRYRFNFTEDYLLIYGIKKNTLFLLNPEFGYFQVAADVCENTSKPIVVLSEVKTEFLSKKITEIEYDLKTLFDSNDKQIRRGVRLAQNRDIQIKDTDNLETNLTLFDKWKEYKLNDPKVFRISFTPDRYRRTYLLKELGFHIFEKIVYVKEKPYAVINFAINRDRAYELSFVSLFFDPELKLMNDLNDCIIIYCMHQMYLHHGIKYVNLGTDAGIKGLRFFKRQFHYNPVYVYKN